MQRLNKLISQYSNKHDVYVTDDFNGKVNDGIVGAETIESLLNEKSSMPIVVASKVYMKLINMYVNIFPTSV